MAGPGIMSNLTLPVITNDKTDGEQNFILERNVFPEPVIDKGGDRGLIPGKINFTVNRLRKF